MSACERDSVDARSQEDVAQAVSAAPGAAAPLRRQPDVVLNAPRVSTHVSLACVDDPLRGEDDNATA